MPIDEQFCILGVEEIDDDCRANRCTLQMQVLLTNSRIIVIDRIPFLLISDAIFSLGASSMVSIMTFP
jgi:hypothetical protein